MDEKGSKAQYGLTSLVRFDLVAGLCDVDVLMEIVCGLAVDRFLLMCYSVCLYLDDERGMKKREEEASRVALIFRGMAVTCISNLKQL